MAITFSSPKQKLVTIKHCDFPSKDNNYGILTRKVANIGISTLKKHPTAFLLYKAAEAYCLSRQTTT